MRGCGLVVGRWGEPILGFSLMLFWGEMSYRDDISPKRSKHELESLDACHKGWYGKGLTLIRMRVLRKVRDKAKTFLFGNETWCNLRNVMVVTEQPADQLVVLEGHSQRAKSS